MFSVFLFVGLKKNRISDILIVRKFDRKGEDYHEEALCNIIIFRRRWI